MVREDRPQRSTETTYDLKMMSLVFLTVGGTGAAIGAPPPFTAGGFAAHVPFAGGGLIRVASGANVPAFALTIAGGAAGLGKAAFDNGPRGAGGGLCLIPLAPGGGKGVAGGAFPARALLIASIWFSANRISSRCALRCQQPCFETSHWCRTAWLAYLPSA